LCVSEKGAFFFFFCGRSIKCPVELTGGLSLRYIMTALKCEIFLEDFDDYQGSSKGHKKSKKTFAIKG
jgi:hypothetical protein